MQQQQQGGGGGGGGSQFGVPPQPQAPQDMPPFSSPRPRIPEISLAAEAASPISSRPPAPQFEELGGGAAGGSGGPGGFDDEALAAGDEGERGGSAGNRWPRQETLALLKIRSDMDAAFRDATLKGPLWEEVSRKLLELGYRRSAKKCKEKFENVHKYYKRTKENRAGRQDGKTYRFFTQLEALHAAAAPALPSPVGVAPTTAGMAGPSSARAPAEPPPPTLPFGAPPATVQPMPGAAAAMPMGISFSSNTSESDEEDSDDEDTEEIGGADERGKRKRRSGSGGSSGGGKMMRFFEGLMKQVMERQEAMQQRFLETIEKREQDRMIREEAWRRQEMARLSREQEILAQERAMAASRDAAVISFIQKITGQTIPLPSIAAPAITVVPPPPSQPSPVAATTPPSQQQQRPPPPPPQPSHPQPQPQQKSPMPMPMPQQQQPQPQPQQQQMQRHQQSMDLVPVPEPHDQVTTVGFEASTSSSRWPKAEVHALIQLRSNLDARYQEAGPKGPLWEEISAGMRRMGYNRNAKRCKEKWENINKYFKKVKESNKKRPEDSKTCPYFHQLDALYRNKALQSTAGSSASAGGAAAPRQPEHEGSNTHVNSQERGDSVTVATPPTSQPPQAEAATKNGNNGSGNGRRNGGGGTDQGGGGGGGGSGGMQMQTSNGGATARFFEEGGGIAMKKPEDIVKETMGHRQRQAAMDSYDKMDGADSDNMELDDDDYDDDEDDDDDDDDDDGKMQYEIQFQRQNVRPNVSGAGGTGNTPGSAAPATATTSGSFLAMVQ